LLLTAGKGAVTNVIQWSVTYSGWDVLLGEVQLLLNQVAYGAGLSLKMIANLL
jgi:hypothetical protein